VTPRALLLARMSSAPAMLRELTSDVTVEQADRLPAPGEWSIADVTRHLVEGDRDTFLPRLRRMLSEARPVFDKAVSIAGDGSDLTTLVGAFASARQQVVTLLTTLDPTGWLREGVSPSRGVLSVEVYADTMDAHDTEHLRQLQSVRARLGLRPKRCEARAPLAGRDLIVELAAAAGRLRAVTAGLDEAHRRRRPAPGEWCLNEIMAHLLHVERELFLPRLQRIAVEEHPAFAPFSPELWSRERDHSVEAFDESLAAFERARADTIAFLRALAPETGARLGVSGFFGPLSLLQYATHTADHDIEHLAQMARARATALATSR
jgi:DinB superfamily